MIERSYVIATDRRMDNTHVSGSFLLMKNHFVYKQREEGKLMIVLAIILFNI